MKTKERLGKARNEAGMYMKTKVISSKCGNLVEKKEVNSCQATIVC
jgi:hypothetical protein